MSSLTVLLVGCDPAEQDVASEAGSDAGKADDVQGVEIIAMQRGVAIPVSLQPEEGAIYRIDLPWGVDALGVRLDRFESDFAPGLYLAKDAIPCSRPRYEQLRSRQ
jgi:hypothetical protein